MSLSLVCVTDGGCDSGGGGGDSGGGGCDSGGGGGDWFYYRKTWCIKISRTLHAS